MVQKSLQKALRVPCASAVHLPLFLVPSFACASTFRPNCRQSRNYANHAKTPDRSILDPNASRKHLKPDFPMNTNIKNRDKNRRRGVSVIRSTGLKQKLSVSKYDLPVPVIDPERRKEFPTNPEHGLWDFFWEKRRALTPPEDVAIHGRAWTYAELSLKTFEELHALYWLGHKDQNRVLTNAAERTRTFAGYGEWENNERFKTIRKTNDLIKIVLRDRYESTQDALRILEETRLAELDLDEEAEEGYVEIDEYSMADANEEISSSAQESPTPQDLSSKPTSRHQNTA